MGSFGTSKQKSDLTTKQFAGAYGNTGYGDSSRLARSLESLIGAPTSGMRGLEESIMRPQFGPTTASEGALLESLSSMTNANAALRGLGPATPSALAQSLAPALVDMRQRDVENQSNLAGRQMEGRGLDMNTILSLIGLVMPQVVAGQKSSGSSFNFGVSGPKPTP